MNQPELIKIITGLRRSGKSVMLELIRMAMCYFPLKYFFISYSIKTYGITTGFSVILTVT